MLSSKTPKLTKDLSVLERSLFFFLSALYSLTTVCLPITDHSHGSVAHGLTPLPNRRARVSASRHVVVPTQLGPGVQDTT
jgi:Na+/melibiose symporter-like transporter